VSVLRRIIAYEIRITAYILIIATFLAIADLALEATVPDVHRAMGPYIALIITNCIVLGRQEAFASRQSVGLSLLDALSNGIGFTIALLLMGIPRELLGSGTFLGVQVMPASFEPWVVMVLPPGGFFMIAALLLLANWHDLRKLARDAERSQTTRKAA
jgi:electron transport complex protein RnfE